MVLLVSECFKGIPLVLTVDRFQAEVFSPPTGRLKSPDGAAMEDFTNAFFNGSFPGDPTPMAAFLLSYSFLGVLGFASAFWSNSGRLRFLARSLVFFECLAPLLLVDLVHVTATVALAAQLHYGCRSTCVRTFGVWVLSKRFMEGLHLLCALECTLFLRKPHWGSGLQLVATYVALLFIIRAPLYLSLMHHVSLMGEAVVNCGMALAIITTAFSGAAVPGKVPVVSVAMLTFFPSYLPKFLLLLNAPVRHWNPQALVFSEFLLYNNFQLILDGCLFFCVLKLPVQEHLQINAKREQKPGCKPGNK